MIQEYTKAVGALQELFTELYEQGAISETQAQKFDEAQRVLLNFHSWVQKKTDTNIKVQMPWEDPVFIQKWAVWVAYKKQQFQFTYKTIAEQAALKHLAELSGGDMNKAIYLIEYAISKGWKGIFLPRDMGGNAIMGTANPQPDSPQPRNVAYKQDLLKRLSKGQ